MKNAKRTQTRNSEPREKITKRSQPPWIADFQDLQISDCLGTAVHSRCNEFYETNPPYRRWSKSDSRTDETPIMEFTKRSHALCAQFKVQGLRFKVPGSAFSA